MLVVFWLLAGALIYHLRTFNMKGDYSIAASYIFIGISVVLTAIVLILFFSFPWEAFLSEIKTF